MVEQDAKRIEEIRISIINLSGWWSVQGERRWTIKISKERIIEFFCSCDACGEILSIVRRPPTVNIVVGKNTKKKKNTVRSDCEEKFRSN